MKLLRCLPRALFILPVLTVTLAATTARGILCDSLLQPKSSEKFDAYLKQTTQQDYANLRQILRRIPEREIGWSYRRVVHDLIYRMDIDRKNIRLISIYGDADVRAFLAKSNYPINVLGNQLGFVAASLTSLTSAFLSIATLNPSMPSSLSMAIPAAGLASLYLAETYFERLHEREFWAENMGMRARVKPNISTDIYIRQTFGPGHRALGGGFSRGTVMLVFSKTRYQPHLYVVYRK